MGHVLGAEKSLFFIRGRGRPTVYGGRANGILSIRGPEVSPGSPRVVVDVRNSPTPHALVLGALQRALDPKLWGLGLRPEVWPRTCTDMYIPMEAPAHAALAFARV